MEFGAREKITFLDMLKFKEFTNLLIEIQQNDLLLSLASSISSCESTCNNVIIRVIPKELKLSNSETRHLFRKAADTDL